MVVKPAFATLKSNYRTKPDQIHHCPTMVFPDTCAIRMSEALVTTNAAFLDAFKSSRNNVCPHGYMRGAQDLAAVLSGPRVFAQRDYGWSAQADKTAAPAEAQGVKGIVCYMKIPGFDGQGHIDLWDGKKPVGHARWDAQTIWLWKLP